MTGQTEHDRRGSLDANQRQLSLEIAMLRCALQDHAARANGDGDSDGRRLRREALHTEATATAASARGASALDVLAQRFTLTSFERQLLLLCAAVELDSSIPRLCAEAQGDTQCAYPTFGLALAVLPDAHWSALLPSAALRYWHLVDFAPAGGSPSAPLTTRPLRIGERVLHYLTGLSHLDDRLASLVFPVLPEADLPPTHRAIAGNIAAAWKRHGHRSRPPLIALHGPDGASARSIAAFACASCGWTLYSITDRAIPANATDQHVVIRLWEREAALESAALLVECDGVSADGYREVAVRDLVDRISGAIVMISRDRHQAGRRPTVSFEVSKPTGTEQRGIWAGALRDAWSGGKRDLARLTEQFSLNAPEIASAAEEACAASGSHPSPADLWAACRRQSRGRLDDLAQRIPSAATIDDLVLPESQKDVLHDIITHVRHRSTVHEDWGFAERGSRGLGISAVFAGASGTGKTMAAEVVAGALGLDLYRIDLSSVVSKYIGETEKNLRRIFDAADAGGVILLFDEADALFGKRSEVKDSHDRYANIEVSYLLQRMECYRGLAILTTNMKSALDSAFLRRLRFIVQFPFPDAAQRAEIWRRIFPSNTPVHELDVVRLSQLNVAGGSIRNVALGAAFLAADANEPVGMSHLLRAARSEYAKLEKPLTDAEIAGWT